MAATLFDRLAQLRLGDLAAPEPAACDAQAGMARMLGAAPPAPPRASPPPPPAEDAAQGSYRPFASVDIRHGFYNRTSGTCSDIAVEPTPETRRRLTLFGLLARPRIGGIDLFWDAAVRAQAHALLAPIAARDGAISAEIQDRLFTPPLLFACNVANPRFANFTDLPTDFRVGDPPLLLSTRRADKTAIAVNWRRLVRRQSLLLCGGMEVRDAVEAEADPDAEEAMLPALHPADRERQALYARAQCFAMLEFHLVAKRAAEGPATLVFDPAPADGHSFFRPVRYTVDFAARPTRWRYLVAGRGAPIAPDSLRVVTRDGTDAGFVLDGAPVILPDGRAAACLSARDPRPLLARTQAELRLEGKPAAGRARSRILVDRLPGPTPERILPTAGGAPRSDIYVFL
ncbi:hypothetical protein [Sphingomonas xinjiangensis]|uniref:Uncharacterized protein n=1 Tax=Sphingomonas xinjiangensis TaxID=643568 RepID=A0A840YD78_9SPHN|nr:hypothetical protein [Sphingomonas xinjiangensis]MBB5710804.1 hypothetical protein [Sphingomonas xinjiangensis]